MEAGWLRKKRTRGWSSDLVPILRLNLNRGRGHERGLGKIKVSDMKPRTDVANFDSCAHRIVGVSN